MRILTILTYYWPHWTGLTAHAVRVAEGLAARGHQVTVLTARHEPDLPATERHAGVDIVRLDPIGRFSRGMITPGFPAAAIRLIAEHDVVQIHTPLPEAPFVGLLCKILGRPMLMTHHGDVVMPKGIGNQAIQRVAFELLSFAGRLAGRVSSYSKDYADNSRLLSQFRDKLSYIRPPVWIPQPSPQGVASLREELGLEGKRVIGFAGRWTDEKGFDYLLQAAPLVREAFPEAHLVFAGEERIVYEDTFAKCQPLIDSQRDHVTFMGLVLDSQRMADFYAMCDVFVLPSRTDMLALVQVEAMLCGTPVVATDIPGARVVVRDTGFGLLVRPHSPEALAKGIVEVMENRELYAPTEEGVRESFNTERTIDQYEEALRLAMGRPGSASVAATTSERRSTGSERRSTDLGSVESAPGAPELAQGGADSERTGVDRPQEGIEPTSGGAVSAQSGAVSAQSGAVSAQSGAVSAQSGAVSAQSGAVPQQGGADRGSRDAVSVQGDADSAHGRAERAQGGADSDRQGDVDADPQQAPPT